MSSESVLSLSFCLFVFIFFLPQNFILFLMVKLLFISFMSLFMEVRRQLVAVSFLLLPWEFLVAWLIQPESLLAEAFIGP